MNNNDLTGKKFGEWTVLKYKGNTKWECQCSCGNIKEVESGKLLRGMTKSCGCNKRKKLEGKKFGEWAVIKYKGNNYYECKCSCGKVREVLSQNLINGSTSSCGHTRQSNKPIDLTGKEFNELSALEYDRNSHKWKCQCSCGRITYVRSRDLRSGRIKSCGHFNITGKLNDITGKKFGEWTVLKYAGNKKWECRCSCGKIKEVESSKLLRGMTKSCGCKIADNYRKTMINRYGDISSSRIHSNRTDRQIELSSDREKLKEFLIEYQNSNEIKIDTFELSEILDIEHGTTIWLLNKYNLNKYIRYLSGESKAELDIREYIQQLNPELDIKIKNRDIINNRELDIYIPEKKLAIEFNGTYWHSDKYKDKYYHRDKTLACKNNGVRLLHIFEYEWINPKQQIKIKNYLKDIIVGTNVIPARKCSIIEVDKGKYKDFTERYHLQSYVNSKLVLGLIYEDELVQLMSFCKSRFNTEYEYEIARLCSKSGVSVIGGPSRLLNRFIERYNSKSIVSYCDISKFSGNVYESMKFSFVGYSEPGYKWVKNQEVLSRYQTQKHILCKKGLVAEGKTEDEIMHMLGYDKIYNSGNAIYTLKL